MKIIKNVFLAIIAVVIVLIISIFVMNQISVKPTIAFLRWNLEHGEPFGDHGAYEAVINAVNDEKIVPIKSSPDTSLKLYGSGENLNKPLIFFIHGGGWSLGSSDDVAFYAKILASEGYIVANVDYALAPEYQYPTSTHQLMDSINYLYDHADEYNIDKENIIVMGNSAGAHLTAQLAALVTNQEYASEMNLETSLKKDSIKGVVLYNGVYDFRTAKGNKFPFFNSLTRSYSGYKDIEKYEFVDQMGPLNYVTENFPEAVIVSGDSDPLKPQSLAFSEVLNNNNINNILLTDFEDQDLNHDFMFNLDGKEAQEVLEKVLSFIELKTKQ